MPPDLEDYLWLTGDEGAKWLTRVAQGEGQLYSQATRLRRELSATRTHLVLEQVELRQRAKEKFALAEHMFFTRKGLEQATGETPAVYKASRFAAGSRALDLCCGVGGDLLSLAARGSAAGVERDPIVAHLARHNCSISGVNSTEVLEIDAAKANVAEFAAWHIDPDRRPTGRRTSRVELGEPGLETLDRLLTANHSAAIKLAPAADVPPAWETAAEREWLGDGGECRQQVVWFGSLARHPGQRSATVLARGGEHRTVVEVEGMELPQAETVGRFVFEPQAAILSARLAGELAAEHGLQSITDHGGYLTGDNGVSDAGLAAFAVSDVLPFDLKRIKAWLRERGLGRLEVKKRGLEVDPAEIRRKLAVPGEKRATLLFTQFGKRKVAILAQRLVEPASGAVRK